MHYEYVNNSFLEENIVLFSLHSITHCYSIEDLIMLPNDQFVIYACFCTVLYVHLIKKIIIPRSSHRRPDKS